ncbi:hypothetical protein WME94_52115 [Sorangium sp. So ce429]
MTTTGMTMEAPAREIARDAHDNSFHSRRGSGKWFVAGQVIGFYIYDNNPWEHDKTLRDRHYAELIATMEARGCRLAGRASYPDAGQEDAGYTLALIFVSSARDRVKADHDAARQTIKRLLVRDMAAASAAHN